LDIQTSSTNLGLRLGNTNGTNWDFYSYNDSNLYINNATGTVLTILNSNGNVGIGTAAPGYKLQVNGDAAFFSAAGSLNSIITQGSEGKGRFYLYDGGNATIALQTNGPSYFNAGNVGIGTTAPTSPLHISSATNKTITLDYTAGSGSYSWASFRQSGTEQFRIWGSYSDGYLSFYNDQVSAHQFTLASSGNVGIGTTSPVEKLDVRGGAYINGGTNDNAYDATLYVTANSSNDWGIFVSKPSHDYGIISQVANGSDFGFSVYDGTTHNFRVKGNGTTLIQGNVGIGTTSPGDKLSLAGSTSTTFGLSLEPSGWNNAKHRLTVPVSGDTSVWSFNYNGSAVDSSSYATSSISITQGVVSFSTGAANTAPSERMRIAPSGNVLIGTTTDNGTKLQVSGSVTASANISLGNTSINPVITFTGASVGGFTNGYIQWGGTGVNTTPMLTISTPGSNLEIVTGYNERMVVSSGAGIAIFTNNGSGTYTNRFQLNRNGSINAGAYGSGSITGTPAYNLGVDSSGNIIELPGGVVDGSGTANYVTKWSDANTVTNSSITDDGTTVTATATNFVSQSNLGTAYTSFTTSGTTAIFDTITRTGSAIYQIVIVANPNSAGSGSYQDFYYGKLFVGTGYNGSIVAQFINYHQESPMPRGLYGSGGGDLTVTAVMLVSGSEVTEVANGTSYTIRIKIAGYQVAGAGTVVRLQRIM
jgi:hypothetical protein